MQDQEITVTITGTGTRGQIAHLLRTIADPIRGGTPQGSAVCGKSKVEYEAKKVKE